MACPSTPGRCCCNCCSLRAASITMAVLLIIANVGNIMLEAHNNIKDRQAWKVVGFILYSTEMLLAVGMVVCVFLTSKWRHWLLLPVMVILPVGMIYCVVNVISEWVIVEGTICSVNREHELFELTELTHINTTLEICEHWQLVDLLGLLLCGLSLIINGCTLGVCCGTFAWLKQHDNRIKGGAAIEYEMPYRKY